MNLLFCGNAGVFDGILSCMISVFKRTQSKEAFNIYVMTMDVHHLREDYVPVTDEQISFLDRIAKRYNPQNTVTKIDVTYLYAKFFSGCPNEGCYCSPYTLIRLFADLVDLPSKVLYLDADLLFNKDISLLYDIDISNYEYAAAPDHYGKIILFWQKKFINAGVILFNMDECKKTGLFEKSRAEIQKKKLTFADESAIILSTTKQKKISQRFNDQKFLYKDTVIRHFSKRLFYKPYPHTANIKQWKVTKVHKIFGYENFDDILYEYIWARRCFDEKISL